MAEDERQPTNVVKTYSEQLGKYQNMLNSNRGKYYNRQQKARPARYTVVWKGGNSHGERILDIDAMNKEYTGRSKEHQRRLWGSLVIYQE